MQDLTQLRVGEETLCLALLFDIVVVEETLKIFDYRMQIVT